jgi:hypothetical protein
MTTTILYGVCGSNGYDRRPLVLLKLFPPFVIAPFIGKRSLLFAHPEVVWKLTRPGARRLGAGAPITILQFAPLARLRSVLGFYAIYCVCARFMEQGCVL